MADPISLRYPPIPADFLAAFGGTTQVVWIDEVMGRFRVCVIDNDNDSQRDASTVVRADEPACLLLPSMDVVVESPSAVLYTECVCVQGATHSMRPMPEIAADLRCRDPPNCFHCHPTVQRTVQKRDSVNLGRIFYVCAWPEGKRCSFFRWQDDLPSFTEITLRPTCSVAVVFVWGMKTTEKAATCARKPPAPSTRACRFGRGRGSNRARKSGTVCGPAV